jgi:hypothetical protein
LSGEDFTKEINNNGITGLIKAINDQLDIACNNYGVSAEKSDFIGLRTSQILVELSRKLSNAVVIIDEYDNPLLSTVNKQELNQEIRETLKGFFCVNPSN